MEERDHRKLPTAPPLPAESRRQMKIEALFWDPLLRPPFCSLEEFNRDFRAEVDRGALVLMGSRYGQARRRGRRA